MTEKEQMKIELEMQIKIQNCFLSDDKSSHKFSLFIGNRPDIVGLNILHRNTMRWTKSALV